MYQKIFGIGSGLYEKQGDLLPPVHRKGQNIHLGKSQQVEHAYLVNCSWRPKFIKAFENLHMNYSPPNPLLLLALTTRSFKSIPCRPSPFRVVHICKPNTLETG